MWDYLNTKQFDARLLPIAGYLANKIQGKIILDLNCGHARLLQYLPPSCREYIGNDIDEVAIGELQSQYISALFHCCDDVLVEGLIEEAVGWINILLCLGYATGFSEAESSTLDDSVKILIRYYRPEIVVLEGSTLPVINIRLLSLRDWILRQGYGEEFNFKVDVMKKQDVWALRQIIILEREKVASNLDH